MAEKRGVLILEAEGSPEFPGIWFGATEPKYENDRGFGEMVFNTSMTGYQEILTDPSYFGQIICMTASHIGNTGVNLEDPESRKVWASGFVVNDLGEVPSNWRSQGTLDEYLKKAGVPGLTGVDTRALTRYLRSSGVTRALIVPEGEEKSARARFAKLPRFEGRDLISEVTTPQPYRWDEFDSLFRGVEKKYRVVALDFGVKWNLLRSLAQRGCDITVLPAKSSAAEILSHRPDGIFLSNGPGDPAAATYAHAALRELIGKKPIFGVCMGQQVLGLALGAKTYKLKFGHRGGNHPVRDERTKKVEISSHNHGYAVDAKTLPKNVRVTHIDLNDQCVEGLEVVDQSAFSVQYHPEACPGPHDSDALFDQFVANMKAFPKN